MSQLNKNQEVASENHFPYFVLITYKFTEFLINLCSNVCKLNWEIYGKKIGILF